MNPAGFSVSPVTPPVTGTGAVAVGTGSTAGTQSPDAQPHQGDCQPGPGSEVPRSRSPQPGLGAGAAGQQSHRAVQRRELTGTAGPEPTPAGACARESTFIFAGFPLPVERLDAEERRLLVALRHHWRKNKDPVARVHAFSLTLAAFINRGQLEVVDLVLAQVDRMNPRLGRVLRDTLNEDFRRVMDRTGLPASLFEIKFGLWEWALLPPDQGEDPQGAGCPPGSSAS